MKKLLTFLTLLTLFFGVGWAEEVSTTFENQTGSGSSLTWSNSSFTFSFTETPSGATIAKDSNGRGLQMGAGKGTFILESNQSFTNVTKVSIVASTNGTANVNSISVSVGSTDFGSQNLPKVNNATYDFEHTAASGTIEITVDDQNKSVYILTVTVTYGSGGSQATSHDITYAEVTGGTFTGPTSAAEGAEVTIQATPADGYNFSSWNVTDASGAITVTDNKFTMGTSDVTVSGTFVAKPKYAISVTNGIADPEEAYEGQTVTLLADLPDGKVVDMATTTITPSSVTLSGSGDTYTFTMPNEAVTVVFAFMDAPVQSNRFERITSTDDLEAGVRYLLVCEDGPYAMGAISTGSTKYGEKVETEGNFSYNNGVIVLNDNTNVEPLTLNGAPTEWTFKFGNDSYLNWSSGNSLNSTNSVTQHSQWVIQFDNDGNAKISNLYSINNQSSSSGGVRYIKYNSSSPRFACYTSGQQSIQLYKEVSEVPQVSDVYIIGQVNGHDSDPWVSTEGVQMTYNSTNDNYSADIYCTGVNNGTHEGYSLFLFAKSLPYDWNTTSNLYGSGADGSYWGIGGTNESAFGDEIPLYEGSKNSYRLPAGLYTVTVDLDYTGHEYTTKSVKVTKRDVTMVISPNSSTFEDTKNVTMSSNLTEIGGKIYYTTNGNDPRDPNSGRIEYTEQLTIDATTTFKAVAFIGNLYSEVVEKTYIKTPAAPVITPNGGTIYEATQVTITAEEGATIYYTTDGTAPTPENGTQYTAPFTVSATTTVKARAYVGDVYSSVTTAEFTYSDVQPSTGDFVLVTSASQLVAGNEYIIMTTDKDGYELAMGDINSNNKGTWTQEFDITGNVGEAGSKVSVYSESTTSNSLVNILELEGTNGSWALKQQSAGKYLNISGDNTNINESNSKVNVSFTIYNNNSAKIQGHSDRQILFSDQNNVFGNYATSNAGKSGFEYVYLYTRESNSVQPPVFTPAGGIYDVPVDVTISCATTGASIYYTTDGTEPSATNGTLYNGEEFLVNENTTFKAVAVKGDNSSSVVTAEYTIAPHTAIETVTLDYSEPFTAGIGKFTVQNVSGFAPVWTLDGEFGIKGTSYSANTNPTNNAAVSRFLSPIIDMTDATQPELTFSHQINSYFTDVTNQCQLFIRETTNGTDGTWVQLPITFSDPAANGGWTNDVVDIDLSTYAGKKVQISFLYTNPTAGSGAGTWEIQNFVVADNSEYKMVNNIAEFLALENGTKAKFKNPVTVLYDYAQRGDQEYIWVKDESGYMQFFLQPTLNSSTESSLDPKAAYYENGDIIPAGFVVVKNYYENGKYVQAFSADALNAGFLPATQKGLADPDYIDFDVLSDLDNTNTDHVATWCNRYITLEKIMITSKSGKNFSFADENGTVNNCVGYNKYNGDGSLLKDGTTSANVTVPAAGETLYNVKAILQLWQGGWEIMPIEFTEWKPKEVTLRKLCADGVEQNTYTISNPLQVVYVDTDRKSVWVKDGTGQSIWSTSPEAPNAENFAVDYPDNTRSQQAYYDQSNWCQLVFDDEIPTALINHPIINGGMITGKFTNKMNPTLEIVELGENLVQTETSSYTTNYYMAANFNGPQLGYFFMNPKPQEYADIVWAIYDSSNQTMIMANNSNKNPEGFEGSFKVDMSMNINPSLPLVDGTQTGKGYEHFKAIVRLTSATTNAPMLKDRMPANTEYVVYPLDITQDLPTGINDVNGKAVKSVKYVNVAGVVSDKPFSGVNIVVTEYTDGSRTTSKMLRK